MKQIIKYISSFILLFTLLMLIGCTSTNTTSSSTYTSSHGTITETEEIPSSETPTSTETKPENTESATKPQANTTPSNPTPSTTVQNDETPSETTPIPTFVQAADPNTGISWDGVSPIIYTYPDGSTGTIPRPGAKYEYTPGVIYAVPPDLTDKPEYDGRCSQCGKIEGDGLNGTCLQFIESGHNCPNCGASVPANTCHTCN